MASKVSIAYASKQDGLGRSIEGWYVTDWGIPVGCARQSHDEAMADMRRYLADVRQLLTAVSA